MWWTCRLMVVFNMCATCVTTSANTFCLKFSNLLKNDSFFQGGQQVGTVEALTVLQPDDPGWSPVLASICPAQVSHSRPLSPISSEGAAADPDLWPSWRATKVKVPKDIIRCHPSCWSKSKPKQKIQSGPFLFKISTYFHPNIIQQLSITLSLQNADLCPTHTHTNKDLD